MRTSSVIAIVGLAAGVVLALPGTVSSHPLVPTALVQASGPSPFTSCTADGGEPGVPAPNTELEPSLAVDPADPSRVVASFHQDRWSTGSNRGLVAASSFDGGTNWARLPVPGISSCSGATGRAIDPWVTFADGVALHVSMSEHREPMGTDLRQDMRIFANRSLDGGRSWSAPATLARQVDVVKTFDPVETLDKPSVTGDPTRGGYAYAVWVRFDRAANGGRELANQVELSRTTDAGASWEPGRVILPTSVIRFTIAHQIEVLPDGTLVDVFAGAGTSGKDATTGVYAMRSVDAGVTWSAPIRFAALVPAAVSDPETGQPVDTGALVPDVTVDPHGGALYAVWQDAASGRSAIAFSESRDGGRTWSRKTTVNRTPTNVGAGNQAAFTPSVAVMSDGSVAVAHYDLRENGGDPALDTSYWLVHCHPDPKRPCTDPLSWQETPVTDAPFDMRQAPLRRGAFFLADYNGLAAARDDLLTAFAATESDDRASIFARRLAPGPPADPVLAAAGDIACDPRSPDFNGGFGTANHCHHRAVSDLMLAMTDLDAVLPLGDQQYEEATLTQFSKSYDPTWGRLKSISHPTPGNHEYFTRDAKGYFDYFGPAAGPRDKGFYSFDLGDWHIISLNGNCGTNPGMPGDGIRSCAVGSEQERWLRADLAAHPAVCTLAYWHQPRFVSSTPDPRFPEPVIYDPFWRALYEAGADVVLAGHKHNYERFAPQTPGGTADPVSGLREFVVGTGGEELDGLRVSDVVRPTSEVRNGDAFGVLRMTLHAGSYDWEFVPEGGSGFRDSGSTSCH
jgi:hypothetical protein